MRIGLKPRLLYGGAVTAVMLLIFQNCGPAKLTGGGADVELPGTAESSSNLIGSKVNLAELQQQPQESVANVLYPSTSIVNEFDYANGSPILENIVLKKNDFDRIIWVFEPTETIVSVGESFQESSFDANKVGAYSIFGYRNETPYQIARLRLTSKGAATLGVNSVGAVGIVQTTVETVGDNETILVVAEAPAVDLASVTVTASSKDINLSGRRAVLVTKAVTEAVNVQFVLTDVSGQTLTKIVTLAAKTTVTTTTKVPTTTTQPSTTTSTTTTTTTMPVTWTMCANENATCTFTGTRNVRFGAGTTFVTKTVTGSVLCSTSVFGDPLRGTVKHCDYSSSTSANTPQVLQATPATVSGIGGASITFATNFQAVPMTARYTVFIHFVDPSGATRNEMNYQYTPTVPTTSWTGLVTTTVTIPIPTTTPAGTYSIYMGLFDASGRAMLLMGPGVTVDGQLRYNVGTFTKL
jgi:hypothetical protein